MAQHFFPHCKKSQTPLVARRMLRKALWSAVLSEHVPELGLDEHRRAEWDREGGAQSEMDIITELLGEKHLRKKHLFPILNKLTKTNEQCTYPFVHLIPCVVCLSFTCKTAALPCLVSIDLTAERATIGYLKIMLQAAGPRACDCTQQTLTHHYQRVISYVRVNETPEPQWGIEWPKDFPWGGNTGPRRLR